MKQKLLLVSTAMLMASSVYADWKMPSTPVDPTVDGKSTYLLYNTGAKGFLVAGNNWGTHACVAKEDSVPVGYFFRLSNVEGKEGYVSLEDSCEYKGNTWKLMFADGALDAIFMDRGSQPIEKTYWQLNKTEKGYTIENFFIQGANTDGTYLLAAPADMPTTPAGGSGGSLSTGAVSLAFINADSTAFNNWIFIDGAKVLAYQASAALKTAIEDAKAKFPDIDLAAEQAVYDNLESTAAQIKAATASVTEKLAARTLQEAETKASATNPIDLSGQIVNSTFDVIGNFTGWKGSSFGAGGTTSTCAERFQMAFDTYQDIVGIPSGVYRVNVDGFFRCGTTREDYFANKENNGFNAKVYAGNLAAADTLTAESYIMHLFHGLESDKSEVGGAKDTIDGQTWYYPNSMADFTKFNEAGYYKTNSVLIPVSEGKIRIGVKNTSNRTASWTIVDNFGLTFYGQGEDAYALVTEDMKKNNVLPAELVCTKSLADEYAAIVEAIAVKNYAEYAAAVKAIADKRAEVDANAALWQKLADVIKKANEVINDKSYNGIADDLAWEVQTAEGLMEELDLTSEEIQEIIDGLTELYEDCVSRTPEDTDVTKKYLTNIDFSEGETGWTWDYVPGNTNVRADKAAKCGEAWNNSNFDIHQIVKNVPAGLYEIEVQGFYRRDGGDPAWNLYFNVDGSPRVDKPEVTAFVYMNNAKTPLSNVFEFQSPASDSLYKGKGFITDKLEYEVDGETKTGMYSYPNDMASAGIAFDKGEYKVSAVSLVDEGDPMRIGVKGSSADNSWAIFTRFKLIYRGFKDSLLNVELDKNLVKIDLEKLAEGNEYEGKQFIGSEIKVIVDAAVAAATEARKGNDVKAKFAALSNIYKCLDQIDASVALFAELNKKFEEFFDVVSSAEDCSVETKVEASTFVQQLIASLTGATLTDADAKAAIEQIETLTQKLAIPDTTTASDEEPVDMTSLIKNADFTGGAGNGDWTFYKDGGNGPALASGIEGASAEFWNASAEKLNFDLYQVLKVLPVGTYELSADCGNSFNGVAPGAGEGAARVYATKMTEKDTVDVLSAPIVPNDEAATVGYSNYSVVFKVTENVESIKLGVKSVGVMSARWFVCDNFKLKFYGANSARPETGSDPAAIETIESAQAVSVEIFDLNGAKSNGLKSGINIVRKTDAMGNVKTIKVIVK